MGWTSIRTERKNQQRASLCDAAPLIVLGAERHPSSQDGAQRSSIQLPNLRAAAAQPLSIGSIGVQSTRGPVLGDSGLNMNTMPSRGFDNGFIALLPPRCRDLYSLSMTPAFSRPDRQTGRTRTKASAKKGGVGVWKREQARDDEEKEDEWNGLDRRTALTFCPVSHSLFLSTSFILKIIFLTLFLK